MRTYCTILKNILEIAVQINSITTIENQNISNKYWM